MPRQKTDERIRELKQRAWQKRKKKIKIFLYTAGAAVALLLALNARRLLTVFLWDIKTFRIEEVRIVPYNARPLITGLLEIEAGKNMLFLDVDGLREQIAGIREVENCTVRKIYPSTVEINVTLRKPWIILENGTGTFYVDRTGKILLPPENPENLLRVTGISVSENSLDAGELWKLEVLKEIEKCYNLQNLQKHFSLESIRIVKPTDIVLNETASTRKILLVNEDITGKLEKLRAVLEECERDGTEWDYVDLRFENPYVKYTNIKRVPAN